MSKEVDYLDKILNYQPLTLVERTIIECIKKKIHRLESIDNAEPSEALIEVDKILGYFGSDDVQIETMTLSKCNILKIKQALIKAQKEHKALEIIKEKCVDVFRISYYIRTNRISELEWYKEDRNLTEEELELLKEVLE